MKDDITQQPSLRQQPRPAPIRLEPHALQDTGTDSSPIKPAIPSPIAKKVKQRQSTLPKLAIFSATIICMALMGVVIYLAINESQL